MKLSNSRLIVSTGLACAAALSFSACGGGGGSSSGASNPVVFVPVQDPAPVFVTTPTPIVDPTTGGGFTGNPSGCDASGCNNFAGDDQTKDPDLQLANLQQANMDVRAQAIANTFQMNYDSAVQLAQLADKVQHMKAQGQMTAADRAAVTTSAFQIAGVSPDDVNEAVQRSLNGDDSATEAVLTKAADNLGMPSAAALRDQLLPALGVNVN